MHPTSTQWRQNQSRPITHEGFVELSYYFTDPNLQVRSIHYSNQLARVSQANMVVNQHPKTVEPFATLEPNLWLLDGSRTTVPDVFPSPRPFGGFISNALCGGNGVFTQAASLDIVLQRPAVILPGLTIAWGTAFEEYPVNFTVIALNESGAEIGRHRVEGNNSLITEVSFVMRRVQRIRLEITTWKLGNRRARVGNIFLGHTRVYTKDNIFAFGSTHEINPVSSRLPKYEIAFEIDNRNGDFDPLNEDGLHRFALERQEVTARYGFRNLPGGAVEWIPGGQYFVSDWVAPQNGLSASFKARDLLGFLDGIYYKGVYHGYRPTPDPDGYLCYGCWHNPCICDGIDDGGIIGPPPQLIGISLYNLAEEVLRDAMPHYQGMRDKKWVIDESLRHISTLSPLPIATHAECLQLIANAAGAAITFDRDGLLRIGPLPVFEESGISQTLNDDNTYARPEIEIERPLKGVQVSSYCWQVDDNADTVLYDQVLPVDVGANEFIVEYSDPAIDVRIDLAKLTHSQGFTPYARCASLIIFNRTNAPSTCHIRITGRVIRPDENTIIVMNNDGSEDYSARGEVMPLKNILVTHVNQARTVANALIARYKNRKKASVDWRVDPSLDVGDFIALESNLSRGGSLQGGQQHDVQPYTSRQPQRKMQALASDFRFNGAFIGKTEGTVIP